MFEVGKRYRMCSLSGESEVCTIISREGNVAKITLSRRGVAKWVVNILPWDKNVEFFVFREYTNSPEEKFCYSSDVYNSKEKN